MPKSGDPLLDIHTAGAARHPRSWLGANEAAIHAATACGVRYYDPPNKELLALVVLRVLDKVNAP